ncbi:hypothetical protein M3226_02545 [Neobacillus cucumis]|uniref:hypothetical protein n=1 Tax=Neobacillus cucumis TaxID=1740721 RepID=UPI00203B172F|nr:hypothetical protein [Neobacillus cucumis]MCM3724581.1 hypothetical protein [Neobacillus cucumis]
MITSYLRTAENAGCIITAAGDNLVLHDPSVLKNEHIETLKRYKQAILVNLRRQEEATKNGWIVYSYGEGFEKQVSTNSLVFLFQEKEGSFTVWRGTWRGDSFPKTEKVIIANVEFDEAFKRANNYANWFKEAFGKGGRR